MSIKRYYKQPLPFTVGFPGNPLTIYGKDYVDIQNISMNLKKDPYLDLDDQYLEKFFRIFGVETGDVVFDDVTHTFTMIPGDYGLAVPDTYHLIIAVQVIGITEWIELELKDDVVIITKDKNRA